MPIKEIKQEENDSYGDAAVKTEPAAHVKQETTSTEDDGRRGEKRRSRSRSRSPRHKRPRSDFNVPIENEPEFDMSVVALDWCKYF